MKDIPVPAVNPNVIFHFKYLILCSQLHHWLAVMMTYIYQCFPQSQILFMVVAVADMYWILLQEKKRVETFSNFKCVSLGVNQKDCMQEWGVQL